MGVFVITGIDTNIGKTIATGLLASWLLQQGKAVITQKIAQTGCPSGIAEDILMHRHLMDIPLFPEDREGLTCPYVFPFPAAPELAARLAGEQIELQVITAATEKLLHRYGTVLLEGAGGLAVPLTPELDLLGYLEERRYPVILVTTPRLGSVNHTLLSLEALHRRNIPLAGLLYNGFYAADKEIITDSKMLFLRALKKMSYPEILIDLPDSNNRAATDYSPLFQSYSA